MNNSIHVGTEKMAIEKAGEIVLKILATKVDQETMRSAVNALAKMVIPSATIEDCQFELKTGK